MSDLSKKIFRIAVATYVVVLGFTISTPLLQPVLSPEDQLDWEKALESNTTESFKEYIEKHPDGKFSTLALDNMDWKKAQEKNTIESFENYAKKHSNGQHIVEANQKIESLKNEKTEFLNLVNQGKIFAINTHQKEESSNVSIEILRVLGGQAKTIQDNRLKIQGKEFDYLEYLQYNDQDSIVSITFKITNNQDKKLFFGGNEFLISVSNKQFNLANPTNTIIDNFSGDILPNTTVNFRALINVEDVDFLEVKNIDISVGSAYSETSDGYLIPQTSSFYFSIDLSDKVFESFPIKESGVE